MNIGKIGFRAKLILITSLVVVVPVLVLAIVSYRSSIVSMQSIVESDLGTVVRLARNAMHTNHETGADVANLERDLLSLKLGSTGYIYVMDSKGVLKIHPTKKGENLSPYEFIQEIIKRAATLGPDEVGVTRYDSNNKELRETTSREKIAVYTYYQPLDLIVVAEGYTDEFIGGASSVMARAMAIAIIISLMVCIVSIYFLTKKMFQPLKEMVSQMVVGDLNTKLASERDDEIGDLQRGFDNFVDFIRETLLQVSEASGALASASSEISSSTEEMAAGTQEQTNQASEVASAVEEMAKTIVENSKNAVRTAETAKQAKDTAEQGGKVVEETVAGMNKIAAVVNQSAETVKALGKSSDQIGEIIGVIDDIADQTNLLALNAAIEAARAGEQGRGFAVVADEVRKLAERTTKATKEIATMIKTIQNDTMGAVTSMNDGTKQVDEGIKLAERAGASLKEIVNVSQTVTDMITQIAAASEQQSSTSEQISKNVEAITSVTGQTADGTQQIARAAEDLNRLTENLQQTLRKFRLSDERKIAKSAKPSRLFTKSNLSKLKTATKENVHRASFDVQVAK
jgi:methyl-accepting chemotaxis protein